MAAMGSCAVGQWMAPVTRHLMARVTGFRRLDLRVAREVVDLAAVNGLARRLLPHRPVSGVSATAHRVFVIGLSPCSLLVRHLTP
jgi:hypothetical protein